MSTRANIIIKDGNEKLFFYRHSDGYPDGTLPTLNKFMEWLSAGKIRDNVSQSAGWLILLGAMEYHTTPKYETDKRHGEYGLPETFQDPKDWKCGAYEPTTGVHMDVEYIYTIDLSAKELTYKHV